jgi:ribosomal protein S18 acetylase RimI-like enzyme
MDALELMQLGPGDAAILDRVAEGVWEAAPDAAQLAALLASPSHLLVVALVGGVVVGAVTGTIRLSLCGPAELVIGEIVVGRDHGGRDIARRLLRTIAAQGKARGCLRTCAIVPEPDTETRALCLDAGAAAAGTVMRFDRAG